MYLYLHGDGSRLRRRVRLKPDKAYDQISKTPQATEPKYME